jgi:tRNA A37 threonylcarbamoyladenosine biosynthesis protein TsaE
MQNQQELLDIGFEKMLLPGNVIVIEWGQKVFDVLKKMEKRNDVKVVWVKIDDVGDDKRKLIINN